TLLKPINGVQCVGLDCPTRVPGLESGLPGTSCANHSKFPIIHPLSSRTLLQPLHSLPSQRVLSKSIHDQGRYSCYSVHYHYRRYIRQRHSRVAFDGGTVRMNIHACLVSQRPISHRTGKMTRARGYALAVLFGVCCLGHASAFAQSGPPGPTPYGYSVYPNGGPDPACPEPSYGCSDEVEASINRFGPRVVVDNWFM